MRDTLQLKKLTFAALILLAASASADWAKMGDNDEGSFYIDPASVQREGHLRQV